MQSKHIVIVAGEESGDMHAASLIRQLKANHPSLQISGIGGRHMQAAGAKLISDLARFGVTGISEVLKHIWVIKKAYKQIQQHLQEQKPDLLILVDYPGFNLRLAQFAKKVLGLRVLYYISPQIWAWKANRINIIRKYVDQMAVILPFEKNLYERAGVPVSFVGHPLADTIKPCKDSEAMRLNLQLPLNKRILAMLPGSRSNEIERHMPVLVSTAEVLYKQFPDLHFAIPMAGTINPDKIPRYFKNSKLPVSFIRGQAPETVSCSDLVVVASGTASLECALLAKPMCIIYKVSFITGKFARFLVKVKYLGLCNLLANDMIVPELLQQDCTVQKLTQCLSALLIDVKLSEAMINRLVTLKNNLALKAADCSLYELVVREIIL